MKFGVFSGNGFELQNCYVNKVTDMCGCVFMFKVVVNYLILELQVLLLDMVYVGGLVGYNTSSIITIHTLQVLLLDMVACRWIGWA